MDRREFVMGLGIAGAWAGLSGCGSARPKARAQPPRARSASRQAFRALLEELARIDDEWIGPERGVEAEELPYAHRALGMVLSGALDLYLENDPERPHFVRLISPFRKWGDNPDGLYFFAPLQGDGRYRIRGRRGSEVYLSFTIHGGDADGGWPTRVVADLNLRDMKFREDGSYEVVLSPERPADDSVSWMPMAADAGSVVTRMYFQNERPAASDPSVVPVLSIEPLEPPTSPPAPPDDEVVARRLERVTRWVRSKYGGQLLSPPGGAKPAWFSTEANVLGSPIDWNDGDGGGWGAVDIAYSAGPWRLAENKALVLEGRMPRCLFASCVLWNPFGQTEDYRYRQVSLNKTQLLRDADHRYRIVIAHRDPGVPNWLDTAGHREGTVFWRFMLPEEPPEAPATRVIQLSELQPDP
jgi:hypothetical protein